MSAPPATVPPMRVGDECVVDAGPIAHGGHVVAHAAGRTLFIRHALPGERVRVVVTDVTRRIVRADVVEVLSASVDRVEEPCPHARACGGCDFQHVALRAQRDLKSAVLRDALRRFGHVEDLDGLDGLDTSVHAVPGDVDGLRWRTRMRWAVSASGALALRAHRRHDLVEIGSCPIAASALDVPALGRPPAGTREVIAAQGSDGRVSTTISGRLVDGPARVVEVVGEREWRVAPSGFWQVHPGLAATLQREVLSMGEPAPGQDWWDLYSGAGLLAAALAARVGATGSVEAVEVASEPVREARRALHDLPQVRLHTSDVARWVATRVHGPTPDGVVLDPPRAGAGADVVGMLARLRVPVVVYVACDPVALGRDVGLLRGRGYRLVRVSAHDAFPMTQHVETVALLVREDSAGRVGDVPDHQIS